MFASVFGPARLNSQSVHSAGLFVCIWLWDFEWVRIYAVRLKNHFYRRKFRVVAFLLALSLLTLSVGTSQSVSSRIQKKTSAIDRAGERTGARSLERTSAAFLHLPLSFEPADSANEFVVRGGGPTLSLTPVETAITLRDRRLRITFAGANAHAKAEALDELPGKRNYLIGNDRTKWRTGVSTYAQVRYREIYPGVSVKYYGNGRKLEYDFEVAPGADPRQIRMSLDRGF